MRASSGSRRRVYSASGTPARKSASICSMSHARGAIASGLRRGARRAASRQQRCRAGVAVERGEEAPVGVERQRLLAEPRAAVPAAPGRGSSRPGSARRRRRTCRPPGERRPGGAGGRRRWPARRPARRTRPRAENQKRREAPHASPSSLRVATLGAGVGFLPVDAPVAQLVERDRLAGHRAERRSGRA
jgi:hypothetical protein